MERSENPKPERLVLPQNEWVNPLARIVETPDTHRALSRYRARILPIHFEGVGDFHLSLDRADQLFGRVNKVVLPSREEDAEDLSSWEDRLQRDLYNFSIMGDEEFEKLPYRVRLRLPSGEEYYGEFEDFGEAEGIISNNWRKEGEEENIQLLFPEMDNVLSSVSMKLERIQE